MYREREKEKLAGILLWLLAAVCGIYIVWQINPAPAAAAVQKLTQTAEQGAFRAVTSCLKQAAAPTGFLLGEYPQTAEPGAVGADPSYEQFRKIQETG